MKLTQESLEDLEKTLSEKGYRKMRGHLKKEDYVWWKTFEDTDEKTGYQIAFCVYDFSKYVNYEGNHPIGIQNEFILRNNDFVDRLDLSISDEKMTIEQFEEVCSEFYKTICVGIIFKTITKYEIK